MPICCITAPQNLKFLYASQHLWCYTSTPHPETHSLSRNILLTNGMNIEAFNSRSSVLSSLLAACESFPMAIVFGEMEKFTPYSLSPVFRQYQQFCNCSKIIPQLYCILAHSRGWKPFMKKGCRKKQWQPKDFWATFRMYQLSLDGQKDRVYKKYWDLYDTYSIEKI